MTAGLWRENLSFRHFAHYSRNVMNVTSYVRLPPLFGNCSAYWSCVLCSYSRLYTKHDFIGYSHYKSTVQHSPGNALALEKTEIDFTSNPGHFESSLTLTPIQRSHENQKKKEKILVLCLIYFYNALFFEGIFLLKTESKAIIGGA
ncbi:hypothetical protein BY458DRAFT_546701 [Sporodiniella umbellata]|nr:hypothetical protein BY458DRAFT_546700 [Sporodiniella umbellata]KAI9272456.1 hypothetical protein BY458DRAFT_546701 [Sporodiniella umbellata]